MKKVFLFFAAVLMAVVASAQVDEVTLTVMGTGADEEKATLQALRSAIEQSFGAFVSANTSILNDKLVQDEIVSISNGNIKDYQKLAVAHENGYAAVTVRATVSINKLVSYAKSKGSRAEFSGQTYSANLKLMLLRVSSTQKALDILLSQLDHFAKDMFDFQISIGELKQGKVGGYSKNDNVSDDWWWISSDNEYTIIPVTITAFSNLASTNFYNLYINTLQSLKLTDKECYDYRNAGIKITNWILYAGAWKNGPEIRLDDQKNYLPISYSEMAEIGQKIYNIIENALFYRYSIQEIGARQKYKWAQISPCIYKTMPSVAPKYYGIKTPYYRHNDQIICRFLSSINAYKYIYVAYTQANMLSITSDMAQSITKKKKILTNKEKKDVKNGTYIGDLYDITYGPQKKLFSVNFTLYHRTSEMSNFNGYELLGVSAPTNVK